MRPIAEIVQEFEYMTAELGSLGYRIDNAVRQYPTVAKDYEKFFLEGRELLSDVLVRLDRNWDQVPIKVE